MPVLILVLVFGLALICAGILRWCCQMGRICRPRTGLSLARGRQSFSSFRFSRSPSCRSPWGTARSGWRIQGGGRGDAATMGMGGGGSRRADWIAAAVTCLAIGPVAGVFLGVVFGYLVTAFKYIARQKHSFYGLGEIYGAVVGGQSMGAGSMLGGLIGGATLGWKRGLTVTAAFLGGAVVGLLLSLAMFAQVAMEGSPASGREPWADVLFSFLLPGAAGGMGGVLGADSGPSPEPSGGFLKEHVP